MTISENQQQFNDFLTFPSLESKNLNGKLYQIPEDLTGKLNLVIIAFERRHQDDVDAWVPFLEQIVQRYPEFNYYEFPTLEKWNPFSRFLLKKGMQAGIPSKDTRERTITLHINLDLFLDQLGITDLSEIQLYLLNEQGNIIWQEQGQYSIRKFVQLVLQVSQYLG